NFKTVKRSARSDPAPQRFDIGIGQLFARRHRRLFLMRDELVEATCLRIGGRDDYAVLAACERAFRRPQIQPRRFGRAVAAEAILSENGKGAPRKVCRGFLAPHGVSSQHKSEQRYHVKADRPQHKPPMFSPTLANDHLTPSNSEVSVLN